jgi:hypothetical protein
VLVAAIVGAVVVLGLIALLLVRRPAAETTRHRVPTAAPVTAPPTTAPAPVYGGGMPSGRPRRGF